MSDVQINIYGGTQQINPSATKAEQHFYGDQFAKEMLKQETLGKLNLSPEAEQFGLYINKVEDLPRYLSLLASCADAMDLAQVAMQLLEAEPKITQEEVVKRRFIERLLPLAPKVATSDRGNSIDNIRVRINEALANRTKKRL